jgi:hypothetical protein
MPSSLHWTGTLDRIRRWAGLLWLVLLAQTAFASGEVPAGPELVYWKQNLLTVPYQWSSTAGGAAKSVSLYVSKDRGASWQPISDAQPQLLAFNYRAEADGEYWFSIRTTDAAGGSLVPVAPGLTGVMRPELRVIVDTAMPRIETLSGQVRGDGMLEVRWRVTDVNLGPHSCNIEVQSAGATSWQPAPLSNAVEVSLGTWDGSATFTPPAGSRPAAIRAMVIDLAGNRAVSQAPIANSGPSDQLVSSGAPAIRPLPPVVESESGWVASAASSPSANSAPPPAQPQLWAADGVARAPFGQTPERETNLVFGTPIGTGTSALAEADAPDDERLEIPEPQTEDRPLGYVPPQRKLDVVPSQPFRHVSMSNVSMSSVKEAADQPPRVVEANVPPPPTNPLAKRVNSRTFKLEYELAEVGSGGVAKVELWGTKDGGQSWQKCAEDDDNRSPLEVSVDEEGEYGFSIVVISSGGGNTSPQPGDTPALWVNVDLQPPMAQILSVDTKRGESEAELTVRWEADDDNLESRPIALYYSSRPAGPWTTIATDLDNSGEFQWPVERHVPRKIYLKLEARDTAGNIAAFQSSEPVVVEHDEVVANWQRLPPVE